MPPPGEPDVHNPASHYRYRVVRDDGRPGFTDVALVRSPLTGEKPGGILGRLRHRNPVEAVVVHHRTFRPLLELAPMEAYAAVLERAAEHGNAGTFGCFVRTEQGDDGTVRVTLWERWLDGERLSCEQLAGRSFDASEDGAVAASAEFLAELENWAEARNDERELRRIDESVQEEDRAQRASERADAAAELARILER